MDAINMDTYHLDLLIKIHANDKKFIPNKKIIIIIYQNYM